jgi:polar amino acid transport system ATP-binding protein
MVKVKNLNKSFRGVPILQDLTFEMPALSIFGLVGPSGSGKSTLLRCIQGLESLNSGKIEYEGRCSFMFQDFQLFPHMTVLENLVYATKFHAARTSPHDRAMELLTLLGIPGKADAYPIQLSGGQKQRVALARSLMLNPELLLCDEPTSGLDIASTEEVVLLLRSVQKLGVTMIVASHDLEFMVKIADKILLLKDGAIKVSLVPSEVPSPIEELRKYY